MDDVYSSLVVAIQKTIVDKGFLTRGVKIGLGGKSGDLVEVDVQLGYELIDEDELVDALCALTWGDKFPGYQVCPCAAVYHG